MSYNNVVETRDVTFDENHKESFEQRDAECSP